MHTIQNNWSRNISMRIIKIYWLTRIIWCPNYVRNIILNFELASSSIRDVSITRFITSYWSWAKTTFQLCRATTNINIKPWFIAVLKHDKNERLWIVRNETNVLNTANNLDRVRSWPKIIKNKLVNWRDINVFFQEAPTKTFVYEFQTLSKYLAFPKYIIFLY